MKTPWHIWVVGLLTLAWNGMGAMDYVMTQIKYPPYMAQFTAEQLDYFYSFPTWVYTAWAIAVWFAVFGSLLILLRNRNAPIVLAVSFFALAATSVHNFVLAEVNMQDIVGQESVYFSAAIFIVSLAFWLYARRMRAAGILR